MPLLILSKTTSLRIPRMLIKGNNPKVNNENFNNLLIYFPTYTVIFTDSSKYRDIQSTSFANYILSLAS